MAQGWTIETLKEHIEGILVERDKAINAALQAAEKAVSVAEKNAEKWRDSANEWRGAMNDREKTFMPRAEFESYKSGAEKALSLEKERGDKGEGKSTGYAQFIGYIIAVAALAWSVLKK